VLTLAQQSPAASLSAIETLLFYMLAIFTVLSAWSIVVSNNIVRMAVYFLFTLVGVAGMYFMLNAEFLAAIQLIVYAGGTLILIVFGVMLTNKNPWVQLKPSVGERVVGILIGLIIGGLLILSMIASRFPTLLVSGDRGAASAGNQTQVETVGKALLSGYVVPFEVAGVLLLIVMIGAAYMARRSNTAA
jgi:NADH-quinone oxidoreductase subunit J